MLAIGSNRHIPAGGGVRQVDEPTRRALSPVVAELLRGEPHYSYGPTTTPYASTTYIWIQRHRAAPEPAANGVEPKSS